MLTLLSAVAMGGLLGLLFKVAIACIIIWAVVSLLAWAGIVIPRPIMIILVALVCILVIVWLFQIFGSLMH